MMEQEKVGAPSGAGSRPSDQARSGLGGSRFDPSRAEHADLLKRLREQVFSGRYTMGGAMLSSDGTHMSWGGERIMQSRNPDGSAAAAVIEKLAAENARLRAERQRVDRRIHNQRVALRENWMIVERRFWWIKTYPLKSRYLAHCIELLRRLRKAEDRLHAR